MTSAPSIVRASDCLTLELPDTAARELDLRIEVVDNATDFAALRDEWNELLTFSRSDSFFLTWEWLHTWWIHLGQGRRLFIVSVRSGRQLVAIAPLTVRRTWVGPVTVPLLEFAGTGSIGSDYLDFIVRATYERAAVSALTTFLADTGLSLRLASVKEDSVVATVLSRGLVDRGWERVEVPMGVCPFIDLSVGSWGSYLSSLGPRHRYNFKRRLRNLDKNYAVYLEYADSEQDRHEALRHLVNLHLLRWRRRGGSSALNNSTLLAFHDELSRLARERGWLRLAVLKLDGKAAAALYGFRYGRTFHFYQSGFDPAFQRYSVGLVTLGLTIRNAIEEGARDYDLLHGNETYKLRWAKQARRLVRLELYPPTRIGRMHRSTARVAAATKKFLKRVLPAAVIAGTLTTPD